MSDILAQLHAEHKARHLRFRAMAEIPGNAKRALPAPVPTFEVLPMIVIRSAPLSPSTEAKFAETQERMHQIFGIGVRDIQRIVAGKYGVTVEDINGPRRAVSLTHPRAIAMYVAKIMLPHKSYPELGQAFGGRDHTTLMHSIKKINRLIESDPLLCGEIQALIHDLDEECGAPVKRADATLVVHCAENALPDELYMSG